MTASSDLEEMRSEMNRIKDLLSELKQIIAKNDASPSGSGPAKASVDSGDRLVELQSSTE